MIENWKTLSDLGYLHSTKVGAISSFTIRQFSPYTERQWLSKLFTRYVMNLIKEVSNYNNYKSDLQCREKQWEWGTHEETTIPRFMLLYIMGQFLSKRNSAAKWDLEEISSWWLAGLQINLFTSYTCIIICQHKVYLKQKQIVIDLGHYHSATHSSSSPCTERQWDTTFEFKSPLPHQVYLWYNTSIYTEK